MKRRSIRWQLPLSYAAIALLAALALGLVLLFAINRYYNRLESNYLARYGMSIQTTLSMFSLKDLPPDQLAAQVTSFSLLSQSRVQVLDVGGNLLADSGPLAEGKNNLVFFSVPAKAGAMSATSSERRSSSYTVILNSDEVARVFKGPMLVATDPSLAAGQASGAVVEVQPGPGLPALSVDAQPSLAIVSSITLVEPFSQEFQSTQRSVAQAQFELYDSSGARFGTLVLSEGPAYSRQIATVVAQAWLAAALLAVLLAALVGFFVSRRISRPVTALAAVTTRMAEGDLAARAPTASILELGQLSSAFNSMAAHIEETILALRRFAVDAAHELKTPLTALRTNLDLAQNEADPARRATFLARANEQVQQLNRLVSELLDLSRLESGDHPAVEERLDLAGLVRRISEVYAARAEQSGVAFHLELPDRPAWLLGRQTQLELAVANLLDNALKFTRPEGWVKARLSLEGGQAVLTVEDNGIGIPPDDLPLVFNRFHRAANAWSRQGSGLGLAIVSAVAQTHHGQVRAENLPEGGARLTLVLPLASLPPV